jgi:spore coat polysaccharide biosynthesis protein SpsF
MTALILQARLDSTRLPNKAILPIGGRPLLERAMRALAAAPADRYILACPEDAAAAFAPLAAAVGFEVVVGPKEDVLARYVLAAEYCRADWIIRATGDNPFVFADAVAPILAEAEELEADYAAYAGLPYGAGVEVVRAAALRRAGAEAVLPAEREHVCPYLYNHPETFLLHRPAAPKAWRGGAMRVTVDTADDLARAELLFARLGGPASGADTVRAYRDLFGYGREERRP